MVLYKDKSFASNSEFPDADFMGDADYVISDGSELAKKIIELYPYFDFVFDDEDKLIDVTATEKPPEPEPKPTLEDRIAELEAYNATLTECILEMSEYVYK